MMKRILLTASLLPTSLLAVACSACKKQQPRVLQGISHGAGPDSKWDYVVVWITVAVAVMALFLSVKWLLRPGEKSDTHIKRFVLNNQ